MPKEVELETLYKALLERMVASPAFAKSAQIRLLRFLHDNRARGLESRDIEIQHYKRKPTSSNFNPAHARERINDLRSRLKEYQAMAKLERWQCSLPAPSPGEGYQLTYAPTEWIGPQAFWLHHLARPNGLTVITGSHLFFFNREQKTIAFLRCQRSRSEHRVVAGRSASQASRCQFGWIH